MKTLKLAVLLPLYAFLAWVSVGCAHSQVKPTAFQVDLSWTAAVASGSWPGCSPASPCVYVVSRLTLAAGKTACDPVNVATPNYTPLNAATPAAGASYADTSATGLTACYTVQTEQGSAVSGPSNVAGPFAVPASPLAPSLTGNQTVAEVMPVPTVSGGAPVLSAKLERVR